MISSAICDKSSRVNFSQANQIARAHKACAICSLLHESYSLVIFTVYRTNCCVLLLENFMLFWTSLSNLNGRLRAICLPFVEFFFCFQHSFSNSGLLTPHLSAILFCCAFLTYLSINLISTLYTQFQLSALTYSQPISMLKFFHVYSRIVPFHSPNCIFYPTNETASLSHNNQSDFNACFKKSI